MTDHYIRSLNEAIANLCWSINEKNSQLYLIDQELKKENLDEKIKQELEEEKENLEEDILDLKRDIGALEEILHGIQIQEECYDNNWNDSGYYDY